MIIKSPLTMGYLSWTRGLVGLSISDQTDIIATTFNIVTFNFNIVLIMPLSLASVFNVLNDNFGDPRYDADEILNEFAAQRTIPHTCRWTYVVNDNGTE